MSVILIIIIINKKKKKKNTRARAEITAILTFSILSDLYLYKISVILVSAIIGSPVTELIDSLFFCFFVCIFFVFCHGLLLFM